MMGDTELPPRCPICSRMMSFCAPSHEKSYWACPAAHDPPGIVLRSEEVGYAFTLALVRVNDHFDKWGVDPFDVSDSPDDIPGLVVDLALARLQSEIEFKRMRQRKGHDDTPADARPTAGSPKQPDLERWSA